ncbi:ABC transporter ATP-binding/permease protein YojI [compost metagenome]
MLSAWLEDRPCYLFDEWAADQDPVFKHFFYNRILSDLRERQKLVIVISHDDTYFGLADRLIRIENGMLSDITPGNDADAPALAKVCP